MVDVYKRLSIVLIFILAILFLCAFIFVFLRSPQVLEAERDCNDSTNHDKIGGKDELICEYEKETQLPEQTEDHRPIAKSPNGLISEWRNKPKLNLEPGDIIQYGEHQDVALYLGKDVAHIFGDKLKNYDVLIHMKDDRNGSIHMQLLNWSQEENTTKVRKFNTLESKYQSFSVIEMAKRAKKWVGCKDTKYSYEKYNYKHFAHLIKHGRWESIIENDLKKLYENNDPGKS